MADYGNLLYRRATGELPEMESAKAVAKIVKEWIRPGERVLDVGCGAGHYLRSLRREIIVPFSYTGVDATPAYVALARRAWAGNRETGFQVADVYTLPFNADEYDVVLCCNLLLHLPSIDVPIAELARVARRHVLIRTLIGERSFRIQEVRSPDGREVGGREEFDERGEPRSFGYYNIYAASYVEGLLANISGVKSSRTIPDRNYDVRELSAALAVPGAPANTTRVIDGWQVNGYILLPWHFVIIEL